MGSGEKLKHIKANLLRPNSLLALSLFGGSLLASACGQAAERHSAPTAITQPATTSPEATNRFAPLPAATTTTVPSIVSTLPTSTTQPTPNTIPQLPSHVILDVPDNPPQELALRQQVAKALPTKQLVVLAPAKASAGQALGLLVENTQTGCATTVSFKKYPLGGLLVEFGVYAYKNNLVNPAVNPYGPEVGHADNLLTKQGYSAGAQTASSIPEAIQEINTLTATACKTLPPVAQAVHTSG